MTRPHGGSCLRCGQPATKNVCGPICLLEYRADIYAIVGDHTCIWCLGKDGSHNGICLLGICEREGWCCAICGQPVPLDVPTHHPDRISLDHTLAHSHGGRRTFENLRLAHKRCNNARGCGVPGCRGEDHFSFGPAS